MRWKAVNPSLRSNMHNSGSVSGLSIYNFDHHRSLKPIENHLGLWLVGWQGAGWGRATRPHLVAFCEHNTVSRRSREIAKIISEKVPPRAERWLEALQNLNTSFSPPCLAMIRLYRAISFSPGTTQLDATHRPTIEQNAYQLTIVCKRRTWSWNKSALLKRVYIGRFWADERWMRQWKKELVRANLRMQMSRVMVCSNLVESRWGYKLS